ncbi:hypothetical protein GCM10023116_44790 [Kistimonas scapharcae]|uniref:Uncharacterized protein n=1 Tax=Kistimonas scapharcae TaxID=1036133 RepID=A0ABP8VA88_9GAMM
MMKTYRMELSLGSLCSLSFIVGFGSGIFLGLLGVFTSKAVANPAAWLVVMFFTPFLSGIGGVMSALIAYPFYNWYCNRVKGQVVTGKFLEVEENELDNME